MTRRSIVAATALLAALSVAQASVAAAQATEGGITGTARRVESEEPIAFALVRLLPEQPAPDVAARQTITAADGHWFFANVPVGDYRVQLARIGYHPVLSPLLHVRAGETTHDDIRATTDAITLAAVTVHGEGECLTSEHLALEPRLAALWNEAGKGVEIRRAFEQQYRFTRDRRQDVHVRWRFRTATDEVRHDTLVNDPDSVLIRDQRRRTKRRTEGYMKPGTFLVALPDEKDLLDEQFLTDHCLEAAIEGGDGAVGLRFRPVRARAGLVDIRGTIWVEADSYIIRRLAFDWLQGKRVMGSSTIDYADIVIDGRSLRFPSWGKAFVDPGGMTGALVRDGTATLEYSYRDFRQVSPPWLRKM